MFTACARVPRPEPIVVSTVFKPADGAEVNIRLLVQPEHREQVDRYRAAAFAAVSVCSEWGAFPRPSLTVLDARSGDRVPAAGVDVALSPAPWRDLPPSMVLEMNVARGIARLYWADFARSGSLPPWFVEGLAEFTARRIAVPLFETRALPGGYAVLEHRYFGGIVPRLTNIRMFPESDGEPLPAYRRRPRVDPASASLSVDEARSLAAKTVLALHTLERWIGRPAFDSVMVEFVRRYGGHPVSLGDFTRTASSVSGQDLSWLVAEALGSARTFDYAVDRIESTPDPDGGYRTDVVVQRLGDAVFTGTSAATIGPFESGRGLSLRVTFADGSSRVDTWDGRERSRTFRYRSRAAGTSAEIDPGHIVVLDINRTNNSRALASKTALASTTWSARWLLWLQDLLLTYASLA